MSLEGLLLHQISWGIQGQPFQIVDTGIPAKDDSDFSWGFMCHEAVLTIFISPFTVEVEHLCRV